MVASVTKTRKLLNVSRITFSKVMAVNDKHEQTAKRNNGHKSRLTEDDFSPSAAICYDGWLIVVLTAILWISIDFAGLYTVAVKKIGCNFVRQHALWNMMHKYFLKMFICSRMILQLYMHIKIFRNVLVHSRVKPWAFHNISSHQI